RQYHPAPNRYALASRHQCGHRPRLYHFLLGGRRGKIRTSWQGSSKGQRLSGRIGRRSRLTRTPNPTYRMKGPLFREVFFLGFRPVFYRKWAMPMRLANPHSVYLSPAMRLKNGLFLVFFIAVIFGCSPDPDKIVFDYSREPSYFRADTTQTDHPLCAQSPEIEDCASTKKYRLTWNRPDDTVNLLGYRIYLDSVPPNAPAGEKWDKIQT